MAKKEAPFIFALKHLRLAWDTDAPGGDACLMQGEREVPPAPAAWVSSFLASHCPSGKLPEDVELLMLEMILQGLPHEVKLSFDGISKFGAKRTDDAARCAYEALRLNAECRVARQLLSLLLVSSDVRCAIGSTGEAPDVPAIVTREIQ